MRNRLPTVYWIPIIMFICMLCLAIGLSICSHAQNYNTFKGCPVGGKPLSYDDSMKNRYTIPIIYLTVPFDIVSSMKLNEHTVDSRAFKVTGYCLLVKDGGPETCNCKTTDKTQWDVHIELTKDSKHTTNTDAIVCEINGRIKDIMLAKGIDWSTKTLKKQMVGHMVEIGGYGFYDDHHKQNSVVDNPKGTTLWRHTTLEVHPVTYIKILD